MENRISLEIKDICKSYKNHVILAKASMMAKSGDVVALVGVNGCGKSTLLNMMAGLSKSDSGDINYFIDGKKVSVKDSFDYVAFVPQSGFLVEAISAYDNLLFWYKGDKKRLESDIKSGMIKDLEIDSFIKKPVNKMSGGMKKRVAVACALANNPRVLLLDEVNSSLDIVCKLKIKSVLSQFASRGNIVIMATHEEGDMDICNRTILLDKKTLNEIPVAPLKEIFKSRL